MSKRKPWKPLTDGYEAFVPPFQWREPTAMEIVNACDVLMNAGFTTEALAILDEVLVTHPEVQALRHKGKTAAERRYETVKHD